MKNLYIKLVAMLTVAMLFMQSCDDSNTVVPENEAVDWVGKVSLQIAPSDSSIVVDVNEAGAPVGMSANKEILQLTMDIGNFEINPVSEVFIYATLEEKVNGSYVKYGGDLGKQVAKVNTFTNTDLEVTISAENIYELFKDDFQLSRAFSIIHPDDKITLTWVLRSQDGKLDESRSGSYTFSPKTTIVYYWVWKGKFNYEYIAVGPDMPTYYNINVGDTGSISMTPVAGSSTEFDVSHLLFNFKYGSAGKLFYENTTGLVSVQGSDDAVWTISNVTPTSIDIAWTYYWTQFYDEYGTVTLTRTDGLEWPANLTSN